MANKGDIFSKDEFTFLKEPPKQMEIECPVCHKVTNDPHINYCGHHFCGSRTCTKRLKDSNGACPYCKERVYLTMPNKDRLNGLKVSCTNKGCEWKGELKDLRVHLNKGKREGQCQYEMVTCVHSGCEIKKQRQYLVKHEKDECNQRQVYCRYCHHKGTYQSIINKHYPECNQYPLSCPNKCGLQAIPRCNIPAHLTEECPLQLVECEFKWAGGCQYTPLHVRKHVQLERMSLLAKECRELKKENEELKIEIQELKQTILRIHHTAVSDAYPIRLPVDVPLNGKEVHFYSDACRHHMSVFVMTQVVKTAIFKVYKGTFQQPKVTKVVIKLDGARTTIDARSGCRGYQEYPLRDVIVQKFSFMLGYFYNLQISSVS